MMQKLKIKNYILDDGRPIICVPIIKKSQEDIVKEAKKLVEKQVQMIEWRVDWFENAMSLEAIQDVLKEIRPLLENVMLLFTFRSKKQGGELAAEAPYLIKLYELAAKSGVVDLIDVEFFETKNPRKIIRSIQSQGVAVISSHHDFDETPSEFVIHMILEQMAEGGADIVKLAVMPKNPLDVLSLLAATTKFKEGHKELPVVTMSMGRYGVISRISGETFGSCITFGSHEQPSAPGQLQMETLDKILNYLHETGNR